MMLTAVLKYSYPNATVRAMKGKLLSREDFFTLLNANTYEEFLHILRTTDYAESFAVAESGELPISILTSITYRSLFQDYEKTIRSIGRGSRAFFILLYQKYELINLKTILRGICGQVDPEEVKPLLLPTERYPLFSKEVLLALRDVHLIIDHLQGSFFEQPLNRALHRFEEEKEFFPLEMALDLHYYHTLWDTMEKLPAEEHKIVRQLLGMLVDILNISWIIRFKEQYHFPPEQILNYTIHHGYAFRLRDRRALAEAHNPGEILGYLQKTFYGKAISGNEPLNTLHVVLMRYLITQLQQYFIGYPFQIGVILGYLLLKEFEITDILTIAEAKKYGFSLEQTQEYVVNIKRHT